LIATARNPTHPASRTCGFMTGIDVANQVLRNAIQDASGPLPPTFIFEFLFNEWRRYLVWIYSLHGAGPRWVEALVATDLFLRSVAPIVVEKEKNAVTKELDTVVASVKEAMRMAGTDSGVQVQFLHDLSEWHVHLIARPSTDKNPKDCPRWRLEPRGGHSDTVELTREEMRHKELMDLLDNADIEQIDVEDRWRL